MTMNDVLENRLLSGWARLLPRAPTQLGALHEADCELVPLGDGRLLALTIDAVDEELDVALYRSARTAGRIAVAASLSDLAAVGAEPVGMLLSVSLPASDADAVQSLVAAGAAMACARAGTFVLGGDTSEAERLRIACVGVGTVPTSDVLRRVGARPGDLLFASGPLGAGAALAAVNLLGVEGTGVDEDSFAPPCRIAHGRALRGVASACIDTSDGLFAAVDQLARINGVAIRLATVLGSWLSPEAEAVRARLALGAFPFLAAAHGEFELVFAVPPSRLPALAAAARSLDWQPLSLGSVEEGAGLFVGDARVDGAAIRNLLRASGGDLRRYLTSLVELGRALTSVSAPPSTRRHPR
jgi:thiamine-monophosphate kinase